MRAVRRLLTALLVAGVALFATAAAVAAQTPYTGTGYDISYPQCSSATLPGGSFGIIGVNNGRPFTSYNSQCFAALEAHAQASGTPSLYINTAYSGAYRKNVTTFCAQQGQSMAWQIGCSEAATSFGYAGQPATGSVTMWWLDVETANSWSSRDLSLNQTTIEGAASFLVGKGFPVGVYSTVGAWQTITGSKTTYTPASTTASWIAGQNGACPANGAKSFDSNPIWLSQYVSGFDYDNAC